MNKDEASKNVHMGLLLSMISVIMGLIAWMWTVIFISFAAPGRV
ncbi:MAG: hypothetical protein ACYDGR_02490 [Candidatus Dormibacteria bacterium]